MPIPRFAIRPLSRFCRVVVGLHLATLIAPAWAQSGPPSHVPPPPGFISFCLRFPDQCASTPDGADRIVLTSERSRLLRRVNSDVNWAIRPEDDAEHYGRPEYWTIPTDGYGDCDDYALTKRKALMARGFPKRALRVAIVMSERSGRHAVLVVVTDKGDFILDNLTNAILERRQSDYAWIEQQDAKNPLSWVSLTPSTDNFRKS